MTRYEPKKRSAGVARLFSVAAAVAALLVPAAARAAIDGVTISRPQRSHLTAERRLRLDARRGVDLLLGLQPPARTMQLPGPTLIVNEGDTVTVTLTNALPAAAGNVSIVFPGHAGHATTGGVPGLLTREAPPGGSVTYTFTASRTRDLPLPQRDAAGPAGGDGPLRAR